MSMSDTCGATSLENGRDSLVVSTDYSSEGKRVVAVVVEVSHVADFKQIKQSVGGIGLIILT